MHFLIPVLVNIHTTVCDISKVLFDGWLSPPSKWYKIIERWEVIPMSIPEVGTFSDELMEGMCTLRNQQ